MSPDPLVDIVTCNLARVLHKRRLWLALFGLDDVACMLHRWVQADVATLGRLLKEARDA